MDRKLDGKAA